MNRLALIIMLAAPAAFAQNGWISLFNGKDSTGWRFGGGQDSFKVKDGAMVSNGKVAHAFYEGPVQNHDFKNFELMVDVMTLPNSNGGVYFHTSIRTAAFQKRASRCK